MRIPRGMRPRIRRNGPVSNMRHIDPWAKFETRCSTTLTATSFLAAWISSKELGRVEPSPGDVTLSLTSSWPLSLFSLWPKTTRDCVWIGAWGMRPTRVIQEGNKPSTAAPTVRGRDPNESSNERCYTQEEEIIVES